MEALLAAFAFGSLWYLIFSVAWVILLIFLVEKDHFYLSGINVLIYFFFLNFIVKKDIVGYISHHPGRTLIVVLCYILIGFVWSFIKWWLFVNKEAISYKEKRCAWLKDQKKYRANKMAFSIAGLENITLETEVPEEWKEEWGRQISVRRPVAVEHKQQISHWIVYWPVSAFWSLIEDFIGKVMRVIVVKVRFIYEIITKNAFKNTSDMDWR
jgi:hypothetical protein